MRSVRPMRPTTADAIHETSASCIRCRSVRRGGWRLSGGCAGWNWARENSRADSLAVYWHGWSTAFPGVHNAAVPGSCFSARGNILLPQPLKPTHPQSFAPLNLIIHEPRSFLKVCQALSARTNKLILQCYAQILRLNGSPEHCPVGTQRQPEWRETLFCAKHQLTCWCENSVTTLAGTSASLTSLNSKVMLPSGATVASRYP